jgi:SAM-dependent methyltransferase
MRLTEAKETPMSSEKRPDDPKRIREMVSEGYARVARQASSCCGETSSCCDSSPPGADEAARKIGYEEEQLEAVPDGANLGVGCGNPTAIDALRPGEVVVDLGSGAGMDSFLAARQVGETGRVLGIDMTDAMLEKARENARKAGIDNVEFRKGIIEALPVEDESVDVILSNCVINLSPEKHRVFAEIYRVLKPGGRMMVSDIVLEQALPEKVLWSVDAYIGCVGGASLREEYLETVRKAGFREVRVEREACFGDVIDLDDPQIEEAMKRIEITREQARDYAKAVTSLHVFARK